MSISIMDETTIDDCLNFSCSKKTDRENDEVLRGRQNCGDTSPSSIDSEPEELIHSESDAKKSSDNRKEEVNRVSKKRKSESESHEAHLISWSSKSKSDSTDDDLITVIEQESEIKPAKMSRHSIIKTKESFKKDDADSDEKLIATHAWIVVPYTAPAVSPTTSESLPDQNDGDKDHTASDVEEGETANNEVEENSSEEIRSNGSEKKPNLLRRYLCRYL